MKALRYISGSVSAFAFAMVCLGASTTKPALAVLAVLAPYCLASVAHQATTQRQLNEIIAKLGESQE